MVEKSSPVGKLGNRKSRQFNDINLNAQRSRLLEKLRQQSISTVEARDELNIFAPAARIFELRKFGYKITTTMVCSFDSFGRKHRVARYTLNIGGAK